jgi:hypothetical protein
MSKDITTMQISRETRDQLAKLGSHDDTFDAIVRRLLKSRETSE